MYFLIEVYDVGYMDIYFYVSVIVLVFFLILLWKSSTKPQFITLHNILKFLVVFGVFSIVLINPNVLINGKRVIEKEIEIIK